MRYLTLFAAACACALALAAAALSSEAPEPVVADDVAAVEAPPPPAVEALPPVAEVLDPVWVRRDRQLAPGSRYLLRRIARHRRETWRWQQLMGKQPTPASKSVQRSRDPDYRRWALRLWKKRAVVARRQAHNPPREGAWRCIQRHEGAWNDPNAPYYGGLQMDLGFQRTYGSDLLRRKGTANNWTPLEQMWVAERAYRSGRGFYPWPNTARYCGLI